MTPEERRQLEHDIVHGVPGGTVPQGLLHAAVVVAGMTKYRDRNRPEQLKCRILESGLEVTGRVYNRPDGNYLVDKHGTLRRCLVLGEKEDGIHVVLEKRLTKKEKKAAKRSRARR